MCQWVITKYYSGAEEQSVPWAWTATSQLAALTGSLPAWLLAVAPPLNLHVLDITEHSIQLGWEGSAATTDYLITYVATSPGGVQQEMQVPGSQSRCTITELEPGMEYNISVYATLNSKASLPVSTQVSTCKSASCLSFTSFESPYLVQTLDDAAG